MEGAASVAKLQAVADAGLVRSLSVWALPRGVGSCYWSWEKRIPVNRLGLQSCRGFESAQEWADSTGLM